MQVIEQNSDGLKRTLRVVIGKAELGERLTQRIESVKDRVQLKGFRKGKVPPAHLKRLVGKSLMQEVVQEAVKETSLKAVADRKERPALQPEIKLTGDQAEIEKMMDGEADLAYSMSFEVIPEIPLADVSTLKLERLTADVPEEDIEKAIDQLRDRSTTFTAEEGRAAVDGDRVTMDFIGRIDGEAFEGGSAENAPIVIGQGMFIPGFEDGLKGMKAGETRTVKATFPADYMMKDLAGKEAAFEVTAKEIAAPSRPAVDDEFAKSLGADDVAKLREMVTEQIAKEFEGASRLKLKREVLDALDKAHTFTLPAGLVDFEFDNIWRQLEQNLKQNGKTFEDEDKTEEQAREEYKKIAERRVRLGLVVGELGEKNNIRVTEDEMRRALIEQARRFPGREKMVYEYFEKTPGAIAELRAPIFEDKVVDFILEKAKPAEKKVSKEELFKQVDEVTQSG